MELSLSEPVLPIPDDLSIPEWLKISAEDRKKGWEGRRLTDAHVSTGGGVAAERWKAYNDSIERDRKLKSADALKALKEKHKGQRYDQKIRRWVDDT